VGFAIFACSLFTHGVFMDSIEKAQAYLKNVSLACDEKLAEHLPTVQLAPHRMHEAMRYSMFAGGKRLRPALAMAAFDAFEGQGDQIFWVTSALEMVHTFSLIHDDLPCMDDDDFRRGRPTCHRAYDEATAVLAGDALCIHAFELLARTGNIQSIVTLAKSLGTSGMIGGQIVDIESEGKSVDLATVDFIHERKTAALIEASLVMGAQVAGAEQWEIDVLQEFGRKIGLAFQVVDDVLDITASTEQLGKDAGSDLEKGKATYPALLGVEESMRRADELFNSAMACLDKLPLRKTDILRDIAVFIIHRAN
jgi:geranylgeranyl diphosphate synthase, type II